MNAAVVRRTQEALGKVIRRPPLTEKLLSKPPFRYLHDIITEVIRMTGFMKGLYTDAEMKSDNVKDKDAKISFLQKAIDVVVMVSGEPLLAKPARIVAGHEPERTNELLQIIGKCCLNKLSSDDAVRRVLAGEKGEVKGRASLTSRSQELDNKNVREEESRVHKNTEDRGDAEIKERSTSRDRKQKEELKEDRKPREKDKDKEKAKENGGNRHREGERERAKARARPDNERQKDRGNRERDRDSERKKETERKSEGGKEKERLRDRDRERDRDKGKDRDRRRVKNGEHSWDLDREKNREHDKPEKKTEISTRASKSLTTKTSKRRSKNSVEGRRDPKTSENSLSPEKEHNFSYCKAKKEHSMKQLGRKEDNISAKSLDSIVSGINNEPNQETTTSEIGTKEANINSTSISDDNSASLRCENIQPNPTEKQKGDSTSDAEGDAGPAGQDKSEVPETPEIPNELSSNIRRIPRPGSARPAPPRVKRQDSMEALQMDRSGSGKTVSNVITESHNSDNEEDDQFVVEAAPQLSEMSEIEMVTAVELEEEEKHGGLVKKILETKKDYEKLQQSPKPGEKERSLFESAWKKEKDIVSKEIEKLRTSIQTLCKSALPLGKIMDYIQEDVDAMQNELQMWHSENRQHAEALQQEQRITDCAVEPLKAELAELEQLIKDQQDKICAVKANILKNEEKIQKMVYSINLTSRR
ncbi:TRAF3-interacting protein 1 isoform X4 [Homo sapiens]|uniref:TRAF3-interacting protein 1 isoform X4 n=1 Tax=Homo sapiens TaxID=9606 RepID=UPI0005D02138|nr:TRAF3-interacting protein 1 isoform X4 [Homo sapiens]|eukprot:XP_011509248.1 TRAF3-interacting protein 1 isoform X4 [Homo sapiens]